METMTESFGAGVRSAKTVESLKKSTRQSGKSRKRHPFYFAAPHKLPEQSVDPPVIPVPAAAGSGCEPQTEQLPLKRRISGS